MAATLQATQVAVSGTWPAALDLHPDMARLLGMGAMVMVAAALQGVGGVGFAMVLAPVAALWWPDLVPGPLLALGCVLSALTALRERAAIEWPVVGAALAGRVAGSALAGVALALLSTAALSVAFAVSILVGVALSIAGWRIAPTRSALAVAGVASGLMGTITSAGAPPFAIVMQHASPARVRANLGVVLGVGAAVSLVVLALAGRFGLPQLALGVALAPFMVAGFAGSGLLRERLPRAAVRWLLLGLSAAGAVVVLVRAVG